MSQATAHAGVSPHEGIAPVRALQALRRRVRGAVIEPRGDGRQAATQAFDATVREEPALTAVPADEQDVIEIIDFARAHGMQVTAQRTGHDAEPLGGPDDVILVKTDAMQGVEIDVERRVARVRSGAKWGSVVAPASDLGLAALHGPTTDVSVAVYSLGGGVGWYARKLGLSANSVTAIELVTADGEFRRVDHDNEPDLFWALRGGGGNFGIVTALELQLYSIPDIYAGVLFFPWERSSEVLHAWREWTETLPDELTSVARILQFAPISGLPEHLRGQKLVAVEGAYMGDDASGRDVMRPIRDLGPALDTFAIVEPVGLAELHVQPPTRVPYTGAGRMLGKLDAAAIDRFVAVAGPESGSSLVSSELRHLGGELHRAKPGNGALATFDANFLTCGIGLVRDDTSYRAYRAAIEAHAEAFEPYDNGRRYLNFTEEHIDPARFYTPHAYRRLRQVKRAYDPQNLIRAHPQIDPA